MPQVINTNVLSLNAQRNLAKSSGELATAMQRLSSGLRVNSAKDDAAGLAISERFTTQIRGLNQAVRNANDGISLAQTAEGALSEVSNNLQRIRELAVQARNATNSSDDRAALDAEVQKRIAEIERVAGQTEFNGTKLLDGSFQNQVFQVGANQGQTISIDSIVDVSTASLGTWTSPSTSSAELFIDATNLTVAPADTNGDGSQYDYAGTTFTINGTTVTVAAATGATAAEAKSDQLDKIAAGINAAFADGSVSAGVDTGTLTITGSVALDFEGSDGKTGSLADTALTTVAGTSQTGFAKEDVTTAANADRMILAMDGALKAVNSGRAELGAIQNRFESVIANLSTASENLTSSRSRIQDADFAAETASMTRAQILQQAGTAVLAQANSAPQNVLSLLR